MNSLVQRYREMAAGGQQFRGLSILQHADGIGRLIREHQVRTLLDYGCGAGDAYKSPHKLWHQWGLKRPDVTLYDPSFREHDMPVGRGHDMVVCSDVLEHIPEAEVDAFIENLFRLAGKVLWASVCCRLAKKTFPGTNENLHCTVRPLQWWQDTFTEHAMQRGGVAWTLVETP